MRSSVGTSREPATDREAKNRHRKAAQTTIKISIGVLGDPALIAKTVVQIGGVGKRLSGNYYVMEATHNVDGSGYLVGLKLRSDGGNGHRTLSSILFEQPLKKNREDQSGANTNNSNPDDKSDGELAENTFNGEDGSFAEVTDPKAETTYADTKGRKNLP